MLFLAGALLHRRKLYGLVFTPAGVLPQDKGTPNPQEEGTLLTTDSEKSLAHMSAKVVGQTLRTKPINFSVLRSWCQILSGPELVSVRPWPRKEDL